jgi:Xaa-Pro aminopeptidase
MAGTPATLSERDQRYRRVREEMSRHGLDALIVGGKGHAYTGRGYIRYLTDFHLWAHDALLVFPADGEPMLTVSSPSVARLIAERGWVTDNTGDMQLVPSTLRALAGRGLERSRIGTVGNRWIISANVADALRDGLTGAELLETDDLLDDVRMAKSPLEVAQNREVWDLATSAMERFAELARPGAAQAEVVAESSRVALAGGAREILALIGEDDDAMRPPTDTPLRCSDILRYHMEICGPSGHWCELTITLAYRPPSDAEARLFAAEMDARERVRAAARPGVRLAELGTVFEGALAEAGWTLPGRSGKFDFHGQGQDAIERPVYVAGDGLDSASDAELPVGAVLSYHPGRHVEPAVAWGPGISDNLLVGEHQAEWLSGAWKHEWREVRI